jgi:hypothetical protein
MCNAIVYAQYTEKDILNYIESYHSLAVRKMKDYRHSGQYYIGTRHFGIGSRDK